MNALAKEFTELNSASGLTVAGTWAGFEETNRNYGNYLSSGFAPSYYEGGNNNQVRHAVGGLIAGYVLGESLGLDFMNSREDPNDPLHGAPDIALNGRTVPMGASIAKDIMNAKTLAAWIMDELCVKTN